MIQSLIHRLPGYLAAIACLGAVSPMPAQLTPTYGPSMVTFHVNAHHIPAPMKIMHVMLGDKEIPLDTPVPVEGMWMRTIRVTVQNVSSKTIVECNLSIDFPETVRVTSGPVPSIPIRMGRRPDHGYMRRDGTIQKPYDLGTEMQILPGASVIFKAPEGADWDQTEAYKLVNPITKVNIDFGQIFFSDESKWAIGKYFVAAPPPNLWREVSRDEFNSNTTTQP